MSESNVIKVALVGNPNSGKSTLFNALTGLNQRVGNYPGVTVDKKSGSFKVNNRPIQLYDLPGTYSLYPKSPDGQVVQDILLDPNNPDHPDLLVVVLDASNLKRNLFLACQIMDLGIPMLGVMNMTDVAKRRGRDVNIELLEQETGIPFIETNALRSEGLEQLKLKIAEGGEIASASYTPQIAWEELKNDAVFRNRSPYAVYNIVASGRSSLLGSEKTNTTVKQLIENGAINPNQMQLDEITERYSYINELFRQVSPGEQKKSDFRSDRLDTILTHPILGTLIFLGIFFLIFQAVFSLAVYPMDWIDAGMSWVMEQTSSILPQGKINDFITEGLLAGLAGVVVFIPQIMILFGLITILEDSGYMARASFINDKLLRKAGMNGKAIVPLVGGFACAVPAIMAARAIENPRERLITIMITPLMSCSARLPVYIFLVAFIVPEDYYFGILSLQGLFMLGLYLLGVVMSAVVAALLNYFLPKGRSNSFAMEMPPFAIPRFQNVLNSMISKGKTFVMEAGKIIILVSMVLWFLSSYGPGDQFAEAESLVRTTHVMESEDRLEELISSEQLKVSYAGYLGHFIEPAIEPLGFDWKIGIALITSFAAREVFVGTMSTIYSVEGGVDSISALQEKLKNEVNPTTGKPVLSVATAFSLVIFYVFAMQCMSTVAIARKETGGWKWPIIQIIYLTGMAYLFSLISYQLLA